MERNGNPHDSSKLDFESSKKPRGNSGFPFLEAQGHRAGYVVVQPLFLPDEAQAETHLSRKALP